MSASATQGGHNNLWRDFNEIWEVRKLGKLFILWRSQKVPYTRSTVQIVRKTQYKRGVSFSHYATVWWKHALSINQVYCRQTCPKLLL